MWGRSTKQRRSALRRRQVVDNSDGTFLSNMVVLSLGLTEWWLLAQGWRRCCNRDGWERE